jgi:hypothetical protein
MDRARQAGVACDVGQMAIDQPAIMVGSLHAAPVNVANATYRFSNFRISQ